MFTKLRKWLFGESFNVSEYEDWCALRQQERIKCFVVTKQERVARRYTQGS
jgi:hypothetical protein